MAVNYTNTIIKVRSDSSSNWANNNPILNVGEFAYETNSKKLKIGDGSSRYSSLPYINDNAGLSTQITALEGQVETHTTQITALDSRIEAIENDFESAVEITNNILS